MKRLLYLFGLFALGAASSSCASNQLDSWYGTYAYENILPKTNNGITASTNYYLEIDSTHCQFVAQGLQLDESIICRLSLNSENADIVFVSYGDGSLTNGFGVAVYQPGDVLFSLSHTKGKLKTLWNKYVPDEAPHIKEGTRFQKLN